MTQAIKDAAKRAEAREKKAARPKRSGIMLNAERIDALKDQILIVLADYQSSHDSYGFGRAEGIRLEVANRIIANLRIIASGAP